jgi:hypothetical protein
MWNGWMGAGVGGGMIGGGVLSLLLVGVARWAAVRCFGPATGQRRAAARVQRPLDLLEQRRGATDRR